jgi:hypothetical protein
METRAALERGSGPGARRWWATGRGRLAVGVFAAALLAALALPFYSMSRMMGPRPVTPAAWAAAAPGTQVDVALEVTAAPPDGPLTATLLEHAGGGGYQRTDRSIRVGWRPDTPVVMGRREDVRPGAVLQARGRVAGADRLDAERLVVLTDNVTVRPSAGG